MKNRISINELKEKTEKFLEEKGIKKHKAKILQFKPRSKE